MKTTSAKRRRSTIPDELVVSEVLVRLPVKSLLRVKSVCRSWRAAVEDPSFVRRHLELSRARTTPSVLVIPRDEDDESESEGVSFHRLVLEKDDPADVALMFDKALLPDDHLGMTNAIVPTHCDGLIALATPTGKVFVCNPATREFVALPPGTTGSKIDATAVAIVGYDAWRDKYVVARYFYRRYDQCKQQDAADIGHEIFTLGEEEDSSCWMPTADPPHAIGPSRPICTRNAFYWSTHNRKPKNALLRFGLRDRAFDVVPFPPATADFNHSVDNVAEMGGKLCYVNTATNTAFDVWVADDDDVSRIPRWSLRCRVDFDLFLFGEAVGAEAMIPVADFGDEMLLAADYRTLYSYDARQDRVVRVVDLEDELEYDTADGDDEPCSGGLVHHVLSYAESLVPITEAADSDAVALVEPFVLAALVALASPEAATKAVKLLEPTARKIITGDLYHHRVLLCR
ncbi:hypothetical protein QOZ80_4BG0351940 [Eleusine coracana subsp. coracana]|nr:hypothetical protein QOZ80_4BG0351940 [Eleusine coracana subsp. coracana]